MFNRPLPLLQRTIKAFEAMVDRGQFCMHSNGILLSARNLLTSLKNAEQEDFKNIVIGAILLVMGTEKWKYPHEECFNVNLKETLASIDCKSSEFLENLYDTTTKTDDFAWMDENFDRYQYNSPNTELAIVELGKKIRGEEYKINLAYFPQLAGILPEFFTNSPTIPSSLNSYYTKR